MTITSPAGIGNSRPRLTPSSSAGSRQVVVRRPEARGGREIKPNGDYLESCWWDGGDNMMVHTPFGRSRAISKGAITVQRRK